MFLIILQILFRETLNLFSCTSSSFPFPVNHSVLKLLVMLEKLMNIKFSRLFLLLLLLIIVAASQSGLEKTVGLPEILKEVNKAKLANVTTISLFGYDIYAAQSRLVVSFERKEIEEGGDDVNNN